MLSTLLFALAASAQRISIPIAKSRPQRTTNGTEGSGLLGARDAEINLINFASITYMGSMAFGTPPQTLSNFVFDTGSADLWVTSAQITTTNQFFDKTQSKSFKNDGTTWQMRYGKGECSGTLGDDVVFLGGLSTKTPTKFGLATTVSSDFLSGTNPVTGILGLSFQPQAGYPPLVDVLASRGVIKSRQFSFYLTPGVYDESGSVFILGEPDMSFASSDKIEWIPMMKNQSITTQWLLPLTQWIIPGVYHGCSQEMPCKALIDSGTSLIVVPPELYNPTMQTITKNRPDCALKGNGDGEAGAMFCSGNTKNMPNIELHFGVNLSTNESVKFTITPEDYMIEASSSLWMVGISAIAFTGPQANTVILGDTFMKKYYTLFDMEGMRIGFSPAKAIPTPKWVYFLIIFGGALGVVLVALLVAYCCNYHYGFTACGLFRPPSHAVREFTCCSCCERFRRAPGADHNAVQQREQRAARFGAYRASNPAGLGENMLAGDDASGGV